MTHINIGLCKSVAQYMAFSGISPYKQIEIIKVFLVYLKLRKLYCYKRYFIRLSQPIFHPPLHFSPTSFHMPDITEDNIWHIIMHPPKEFALGMSWAMRNIHVFG